MRRLTTIFALVLFGLSAQAVPTIAPGPSPNITYDCSIPEYLVETILKESAPKLGLTYSEAVEKYEDGTCSIVQVNEKTYKVAYGSGISIIILDDTL